jgi:hypothetical protein
MPSFDMNLDSFKHELATRTAKLKIGYARRKAKRISAVYVARYGRPFDDVILTQIAQKFAVTPLMIPEVIKQIRLGV